VHVPLLPRTLSGQLPLVLLLPSAALIALCLTPVVYVFVRAFGSDVSSAMGIIFAPSSAALLGRSLALVAAVTVLSLVIALTLGFLTSVTDMPARRFWTVVSVAPFAIPCYVGATALLAAASPSGLLGIISTGLGFEGPLSLRGFVPAVLVLTAFTYPYAYLPIRAGFLRLDRSMVEASRSLGKGRRVTLRRVVLPQLVPAMLAGSLLVALYTLSEFGAVSLLRYDTFTRVIYLQYQSAFDRTAAAVSSAMLIVVVLVMLLGFELLTPKHARSSSGAPSTLRPMRVSLGLWRYPAMLIPLAVALVCVIGPIATLGIWYSRSIGHERIGASIAQLTSSSAFLGLGAALACALLAVPIAYLAVRHRRLIVLVAERLTYIGFALPGIVVALGLAFFALRVNDWPGMGWVYQSLAMLIAAYVILYVPQAIGSSRAGFARVPVSVEEAARSLGRPPLRVFTRITFPLASPSIFAGALLVFISTVKELPATLLLAPAGTRTLATTVWRHMDEAEYAMVAAPSLMLIAVSSVAVALIVFREKLTK